MPLINSHSGMKVSTFNPDYEQSLANQKFPGDEVPLNGAGIITLLKVKNSDKLLVLASGKLNPSNKNFENSLALGGGFKFLKNGLNSSFTEAINASIEFKAPAYPLLSENDSNLSSIGLVGFCEQWGKMQYATLHRTIEIETKEDAKKLVEAINLKNEELGKSDRFGVYYLDDVLRAAYVTYEMEENTELKGQKIQESSITVKNLATGECHEKFVIFDDLATAALNKLILNRELTSKIGLFSQTNPKNNQNVKNDNTETLRL
ncbi:hypothetical protein FOG18_12160 [Legionella israelensis]|uniref:hypothetical protein n=1 Tax=Legionella israelensis TaxID=454 RepID=UPI00117FA362|nr:hypothetical protein [Legionella israelensis]QDP73261.1 hypothetical protein FOG18_12160 [Legionella israelensis]